MAGKDISDMSFDEFFLGKKETPKRDRTKPAGGAPAGETQSDIDGSGFSRGRPKLNVRGTSVLLYVPRYDGGKGSRYEASVEQDGKVFRLGQLKVSPLDGGLSSLPTEFDLLDAGVSPLDAFVLSIDGRKVYEMFSHSSMMFDSDGMPISRAADDTVILYPKGKHLWLGDAKVAATTEVGDLIISTVEVARGGYIRVRDRPQPVEKSAEERPKEAPKKQKLKPAGSIELPPAETVASVRDGDSVVPLYREAPDVGFSLRDTDASECVVWLNGEELSLEGFDRSSIPASGRTDLSLVREGKKLDSASFYTIPGFTCSYQGKGDIPEDRTVVVTFDGGEVRRDVYTDLDAPIEVGGTQVGLVWNIPVVTYDVGSGEVPFSESEVCVDGLPDSIVVTVRNASKKALFLGSTGKKSNITPEWDDETVRVDSSVVETAVFESPTRSASLYITVNSCPVRRFLTFVNPADTEVSYTAGEVRVSVRGAGEHVCRVFNLDKTVETHVLSQGDNVVAVGARAISAEVAEIRGGREISVEQVTIRELPFLLRDDMGDVWLYVSKEKRIPLPDGMLENGRKNPAEVRKWHSQIVRMNPELRTVSPEKMIKAFADFN